MRPAPGLAPGNTIHAGGAPLAWNEKPWSQDKG